MIEQKKSTTSNEIQHHKIKSEYKNYAKILDKGILDAKIKYERNLVQNNLSNPKKIMGNYKLKCREKNKIKWYDRLYKGWQR